MAANPLHALLEIPLLSRIRRNHGLEHATLHLLSRRFPRLSMAGHSTAAGFRILGDVPTEAVETAVNNALVRLRAGEHDLAVHPNCGTNFVTAGIFSGLAGALTMLGAGRRRRDALERLPLAAVLATLALIASMPFGMRFQRQVTTSGDPGDLKVTSIRRLGKGGMTVHIVKTEG